MSLTPALAAALTTSTPNQQGLIVEVATGRHLTVAEFSRSLSANDILVFGEQHAVDESDPDSIVHQGHQIELLKSLPKVNLGMEFLEYPKQNFVDQYLLGQMTDLDFQTAVGWGSNPFSLYKQQILAPVAGGGSTWAINMPREITKQISKQGLGSLTPEQQSFLPPHLSRGRALYFARFEEVMSGHATPEQIENYFWAQSTWDETMAWRTLLLISDPKTNKDYVTVIIVGAFHVEYGGGLPDRLKARILNDWPNGNGPRVKTLVQMDLPNLEAKTIESALAPDPKYGLISDYVWVY